MDHAAERRVGLSIDVDSVASHLAGYGYDDATDRTTALDIAVPRILDVLRESGARATFFLIAGEARDRRDVVRAIVEAGHEVASHSLSHALPFGGPRGERLDAEIVDSKALLESLGAPPVVGFRAPSWDVGPGVLERLVSAGYAYDASSYPSFLLPVLRRAVARRSRLRRSRTEDSAWRQAFGRAGVHRRETSAGAIVEIPMFTVPGLRLPYYHTMRFVLPAAAFGLLERLARVRPGPMWYQFHAVDFMGLEEDQLEARMIAHPGADWPLERKLSEARERLSRLARSGDIVPLREIAGTLPGSD